MTGDFAREIQVYQDLRVLQARLVLAVVQKKRYSVVLKVNAVSEEWKENQEWWVFLDSRDIQWVL